MKYKTDDNDGCTNKNPTMGQGFKLHKLIKNLSVTLLNAAIITEICFWGLISK